MSDIELLDEAEIVSKGRSCNGVHPALAGEVVRVGIVAISEGVIL